MWSRTRVLILSPRIPDYCDSDDPANRDRWHHADVEEAVDDTADCRSDDPGDDELADEAEDANQSIPSASANCSSNRTCSAC